MSPCFDPRLALITADNVSEVVDLQALGPVASACLGLILDEIAGTTGVTRAAIAAAMVERVAGIDRMSDEERLAAFLDGSTFEGFLADSQGTRYWVLGSVLAALFGDAGQVLWVTRRTPAPSPT